METAELGSELPFGPPHIENPMPFGATPVPSGSSAMLSEGHMKVLIWLAARSQSRRSAGDVPRKLKKGSLYPGWGLTVPGAEPGFSRYTLRSSETFRLL